MSERLRILYLAARIDDSALADAVIRGWITQPDADAIRSPDTDGGTP